MCIDLAIPISSKRITYCRHEYIPDQTTKRGLESTHWISGEIRTNVGLYARHGWLRCNHKLRCSGLLRDGEGGIKAILHKEYGVGYNAIDSIPTALADDIGGLTKTTPWTIGMVEAWDETYDVSLPIDMII